MGGPRDYSAGTKAGLHMLSRGRCYFPQCEMKILRFLDGEPYVDFQIAHIRDANPGNRYVETMTDSERRAFANLILLCKPHHELVDKRHPERYAIEDLESWKLSREAKAITQLSEIGPVTQDLLAELLTQSAAEVQMQVSQTLLEQEANLRARVTAVRNDASFVRVHDAFTAADELSLLSPLGVRAVAPATEFHVRVQRVGDNLAVHLDTNWNPAVFSQMWHQDETFAEVILELADQARRTSYWPGAQRWDLASSLNAIVDVLDTGLNGKSRGDRISNAVQLVASSWILSDWDAVALGNNYQVPYDRLDEDDWYDHLVAKDWTDRVEVAEMLDQAIFLRALAARTER